MSTPSTPPAAPPPANGGNNLDSAKAAARGLMDRLSLGGKLMMGGAVLGVVAFVLKAYSASGHTNLGGLGDLAKNLGDAGKNFPLGGGGVSNSLMMFETWQGVVAFLGCLATGVLAFLLYGERPHASAKELTFAALGASGLALLVSLLLLFSMSRGASVSVPGFEMSIGPGLGAYLMIVAAGVCVAGSVLHARATKVF